MVTSGVTKKDDTMKKLIALIATTMVLVFTTAASADLLDGLVGYWPFDGDAKDYSGNGNHGITHGVSLTSDRDGNSSKAYYFGNGKYISAGNNTKLNSILDFSLAFWIKLNSYEANSTTGIKWTAVISKGDMSSGGRQFGLQLGINTNNCPFWQLVAGDRLSFSGLALGQWTHLVVTRNNQSASLYVNGSRVASGSTYSYPVKNAGDLEFGRDAPGDLEYLHGSMDEIFLYNRALSSSEIHALYNGDLKVCSILFDSNGGEGNMAAQKALTGTALALSANTFTRDGYLFQGWATSPDGPVVYSDGEEITVDSDKTLYAVWNNPTLTLEAESADWSSGSLTLRCTDSDTSDVAHKYSLFYRDTGTWAMVPIESEGAVAVSTGPDGAAHLTDSGFTSRQGGLGEVYYCVRDENGRVSDSIPTRRRHGLPVGVGQYGNAERRGLTELREAPALAREFGRVARQHGGFACRAALAGESATCQALDDALDEMAAKANPGDICLFYLNTHGGMDGTQGVFCMYDDDYFESRLIGKVQQFYEKGAAFVAVLGTCHSEALVQRSFPNVGIIAAATVESESDDFFDKFLVRYGWEGGWAGSGESVSFGELAEYARERYETLYNGIMFYDEESGEITTRQAQIDNEGLLARITAGKRGTHGSSAAPNAVLDIAATQGTSGNQVEVSWNADDRADGYLVFGGRGNSSACLGIRIAKLATCTFRLSTYPWLADSSADRPAVFEVRAYNGAGIGTSDLAEGWIDADATTGLPLDWLQCHPDIAEASGGDVEVAAAMTAANGKLTVAECYALGIDPDNKDDNLCIEQFEMVDGKPVITLNHTADGSGKTFLPDVRVLGTSALGESPQWDDVTDIANPDAAGYRFFKATVELP